MKYYISFIFILTVICFSQTEISGELSGTLEVSGSPYYVVDDIYIPSGNELTIEPGCVVEFSGNYKIVVETGASFISEGTEIAPILFTCPSSSIIDDIHRYDGIIANNPEEFVFSHCIVENAYSRSSSIIQLEHDDSLRIDNCEFRNNISFTSTPSIELGAIFNYSGQCLLIEDCIFSYNQGHYSGGISCIGDLQVKSCIFENNSSAISGGAIFVRDYTNCHIEDSRFDRNSSQNGGAVSLELSSTISNQKIFFEHNICSFNSADDYGGALYSERSGKLFMNNSVFVGNRAAYGGAFADISTSPETFNFIVKHCTFFNNNATIGTISSATNYGNNIFLNSILYDSYETSNLMWNSGGMRLMTRFDHCLVDDERLTLLGARRFTDCFLEDPLFIDSDLSDSTYDLSLQAGSPCIDNGNYMFYEYTDSSYYACTDDILWESRPAFFDFDIGAYEYPGDFINEAPIIDCPGEVIEFSCPFDSLIIHVDDLCWDSLYVESSESIIYESCFSSPNSFSVCFDALIYDSLLDGRDIMFSVSDGELADTCIFSIRCILDLIEPGDCDEDTVYIYVGSRNDTVLYRTNGISPESTTYSYLENCGDEYLVDENLVSAGIHYEYTLTLTANEDLLGEHLCNVSFFDSTRFRCVDLRIIALERPNTSPDFFGCPDTMVILQPSEITFVYLQIEDPEGDEFTVELIEYPEPHEGFWDFREDIVGNTHHIYIQFYPSIEDSGMYIFRFNANDGNEESECIIYTFVTKDPSQLCPYVEPDTVFIQYLEGYPELEEVAIYDYFNIHNWHIENDCDSFLCIYPQYGFGTDTSTIIPECIENKLELVFAVDVTGSMMDEITRVIEGISDIVNMMDSAMIDVRYGLCPFRDETWTVDMDGYMPGFNLTSSSEIILDSLESLDARGGGDAPEVSLDAIAYAIDNYDWSEGSYKVIVLLTDIWYHYRDDGTEFSEYLPEEIESLLLENSIALSTICEYDHGEYEWYVTTSEITGGNFYDIDVDYRDIYHDILDELALYLSLSNYLTAGTYECNLTYVMDYPVTCLNIEVPVIINILDSTETYYTYNCPFDTIIIAPEVCDTVTIDIEYSCCDSPYVNLVEYPIIHPDMWTFENRAGYNRNDVNFIFTPEATDSGLYYYRLEYGNEFGSDTCSFFVRVLGQEPFYHFYEGWNLLSYPFTVPNTELVTLNPDSVKPYTWNASDYTYELPDEITTADAFWLYSNIEMYYDIHYTTISEITTTLYAGWNMVSSTGDTLDIDILTTHSEVVTPVYYYNTNAGEYEPASQILPGIGYWLMSTETFEITYP